MTTDMHCATCGAALIPHSRFCSRCGAQVELGSVLGVGTDLPPVPQDRAVEEVGDRREPSTFSPGRVAAMVATFVALTVLGTWTLSAIFGSDTPQPRVASASTTAGPGTASPTPQPSTPGSSTPAPSTPVPSASAPSPTPSQSPTVVLPDGARRCSSSGADAVATAWSGNRDTSCAFTDAVRAAYRKAGAATEPRPFRTYSTVTKRWYDVTCDTATPVRCQSADGAAVVLLAP